MRIAIPGTRPKGGSPQDNLEKLGGVRVEEESRSQNSESRRQKHEDCHSLLATDYWLLKQDNPHE
jgi:hypothetical protein